MTRIFRFSITIILALLITDITAFAQRKGAHARSSSRTSVSNKNTNVNRNRNVNRNTNIDVDRDIDVDVDVNRHGGCCYRSGWGTAAAVATTAAVTAAAVGSIVNTLPPSCSVVVANGFTYQQCGNVWYQPQITGSSTTYVVVNAPR
ncbi:MAG: hypothetical protein ACRD8O_21470 [Bryobacteraceae bacterium]